jgi:hypothetical protein
LGNGDCYSIVDRMDGDLTFDIGRNLAARLRVPLVIAGLSPNQVRRILELDAFETRRSEETQRRTTSAGFPLEIIYPIEQRQKYWWDGTAWPKDAVPRVIYPFVAWSYDEDFIRGEVVRLGLIAAGQDNPLATNNDLIPVMLAVDIIRLGYSAFEPEFAELVRANKADRQFWLAMFQALEFLVPRSEFMPQCISETLRRLGLTHGELGIPSGDGKQRSENSVR